MPSYVLGPTRRVDAALGSMSSTSSRSRPATPGAATASARGRSTATTSRTPSGAGARRSATSRCSKKPLAERAIDLSFAEKRALYAAQRRRTRRPTAGVDAWGTAAIAARTAELTRALPEDLGPPRRSSTSTTTGSRPFSMRNAAADGRPAGSGSSSTSSTAASTGRSTTSGTSSTASSSGCGRTRARLSIAFSARRGGPIYAAQSWNGQWDALDESNFLYMGWDSRYMLTAVQGVLDEAGLAPEVFVKYSYIGNAMAKCG